MADRATFCATLLQILDLPLNRYYSLLSMVRDYVANITAIYIAMYSCEFQKRLLQSQITSIRATYALIAY